MFLDFVYAQKSLQRFEKAVESLRAAVMRQVFAYLQLTFYKCVHSAM